MSFRQKLLLIFWPDRLSVCGRDFASVWSTMQRSFERANDDRANAVAAQFRSEFQRRGEEVVASGSRSRQ